jgi:hypothetical protein
MGCIPHVYGTLLRGSPPVYDLMELRRVQLPSMFQWVTVVSEFDRADIAVLRISTTTAGSDPIEGLKFDQNYLIETVLPFGN